MNSIYITEMENYTANSSVFEGELKNENDINSISSFRTRKYTYGNSNKIIEPKKRLGKTKI
jgi:hypothetical protein